MVNPDGTIVRRAEINGVEFRVVSTSRGRTNSVWDAVDRIRNEKTKKDRTETRAKWLALFKNKNWKPIIDNIDNYEI